MSNVHFSSASVDWSTPDSFFLELNKHFRFVLDPCADPDNAKCAIFFTEEQDGLAQDWSACCDASGGGAVFMNPPYGRGIGAWVQKAYETSLAGTPVVCLLPARTATKWWQMYCKPHALIHYVPGRLEFGGCANAAPFPSAVVIFMALGRKSLRG